MLLKVEGYLYSPDEQAHALIHNNVFIRITS